MFSCKWGFSILIFAINFVAKQTMSGHQMRIKTNDDKYLGHLVGNLMARSQSFHQSSCCHQRSLH